MKKLLIILFLLISLQSKSQNHSLFYSLYTSESDWTTLNLSTCNDGSNGLVTISASNLLVPYSAVIDTVYTNKQNLIFEFGNKTNKYKLLLTKDLKQSLFIDMAFVNSPAYKPIVLNLVDHKNTGSSNTLNLEQLLPLIKLLL